MNWKTKDLSFTLIKSIYPADRRLTRQNYRRIVSLLYKRGIKSISTERLLDIIRCKFPVYTQPSQQVFLIENSTEPIYGYGCSYSNYSNRELNAWKCRNIRKWEPFYDDYIGQY